MLLEEIIFKDIYSINIQNKLSVGEKKNHMIE